MNIVDIILKKKDKIELKEEEIKYVVNSYVAGKIMDYQMSSLLMAICLNGMTDNEIINLTKYMMLSGDRMDLTELSPIVDKHSTGGIGDKTTMIIAPIVASCGVNVAKMSGKGLGFTGGTIDKLESIPGFQVKMTSEEFKNQIKEIGLAITSQTDNLVPADKKIYALRDVTGTVESIPLIASSIMSKKIASGTKNIVIDIKVGKGALIKDLDSAKKLANIMTTIAHNNDMRITCLLTNMDIPLGHNIGNSLEVEEVIDVLKNHIDTNLTKLCLELSTYMVKLGLNITYEEANKKVIDNFNNGNAYNKFLELVRHQKGDLTKLPKAKYNYVVKSNKEGYLTKLDALKLGKLSCSLGAGRLNKDDQIDYSVGIVLAKQINDYVKVGDPIFNIFANKEVKEIDGEIFAVTDTKIDDKIIYEII